MDTEMWGSYETEKPTTNDGLLRVERSPVAIGSENQTSKSDYTDSETVVNIPAESEPLPSALPGESKR